MCAYQRPYYVFKVFVHTTRYNPSQVRGYDKQPAFTSDQGTQLPLPPKLTGVASLTLYLLHVFVCGCHTFWCKLIELFSKFCGLVRFSKMADARNRFVPRFSAAYVIQVLENDSRQW